MDNKKSYKERALLADSEQVKAGRGKNIIPQPEKDPLWKRYFEKFNDPLILILFFALALSCALVAYEIGWAGGSWKLIIEPIGILTAILLSTGIGFVVELKAEKEFEILNTVNDDEIVKVFRKVKVAESQYTIRLVEVCKKDVVIGDIVRVEAGDAISADGELILSNHLLIDESAFTGEPFAKKHSDPNADSEQGAAYPCNVVLRGSTVIEGNGIYIVTAIGINTEEGKGAINVQSGKEVQTPLNKQLNGLGKWISGLSMILGVLVLVARVVYYFFVADFDGLDYSTVNNISYVLESVMIAVTLVVAAVPEGLPMSITLSLALSMQRMLHENNLVRKLHACETMGAATVICTDKTGTLTQNKMSVVDSLIPEEVLEKVYLNIAINSTATLNVNPEGKISSLGNPTEGALLRWLEEIKPGENNAFRYQILRETVEVKEQIPFSTETKYMETVCAEGTLLKGAPEVLLAKCDKMAGNLTREIIEATLAEYQAKARRTLAFAADGVFLGIVGIADPIRIDVPEAINICKNKAHVKVIIVTGDNPGTANEIGRQIGLLAENENDKTLTGGEFAAMDDQTIRALLKENKIKIIARAKPDDKARLVRLLQMNKEVVAVTGDGTNDAPALIKAHVGLSMGDGTARAKDASDITIIDNSFASINKAILWGRSIYKNIRRFIVFQTIVNVSACFIVLFGAFVGLDSPLNVMQMLWVNLIMDTFAALALSTVPPDESVMEEKPRSWKAHIISRYTAAYIFTYGIAMFIFLALLWEHLLNNNDGQPHLDEHELGFFFSVFVLLQLWNLPNTRYFDSKRSLFRDLSQLIHRKIEGAQLFSVAFCIIFVIILFGQIIIVEFFGDAFGVDSLSVNKWLIAIFATSPVLLVPEVYRLLRK
ncbi:MAG: calcium-translocating P-type ATPase, PMCA-type [Bacteroidales bacterium]|nr:calcium-translocating P-type ATPase, PMCA-type [Bacteroidales bacterium]